MSKTIMAVDPGGVSGYACIRYSPAELKATKDPTHEFILAHKDKGSLKTGEITGDPTVQACALYDKARTLKADVILIESFYLDSPLLKKVRTGDILLPVKVGWGLAALILKDMGIPIIWRPPSMMSVITDERLKLWNLWIPKQKDARAALKHLIVYLRGDTGIE